MSARLTVERMFAHAKDKNLRVHFAVGGSWTYMTDLKLVVSGAPVASKGIGALTDVAGIEHYANLTDEQIEKYTVPMLSSSDLFVYGWIANTDLLQARGKADTYEIGLLIDTHKIDIVGFSDPREELD